MVGIRFDVEEMKKNVGIRMLLHLGRERIILIDDRVLTT